MYDGVVLPDQLLHSCATQGRHESLLYVGRQVDQRRKWWDRGVFIPELAPRFWRLSLQVSPQDSPLVEPLRLKILDHCSVWLLAQDFHRGFYDYRGGYQSRGVGIENGGLWACRHGSVSRKDVRSAPS